MGSIFSCVKLRHASVSTPETDRNVKDNDNDNDNVNSTPVSSRKIVIDVDRSLPPIPPPSTPQRSRNIYRAMYNYEGMNNDDLSFRKGDNLEIDEESQMIDDWWMGTNLRTGKKGYVPSNYISEDDDTPQNQEWWFDINHNDTDKLLLSPGIRHGTFLIRDSSKKDCLVLCVRDESTVKHYKITSLDNGGYCLRSKKKFDTVAELIDHYTVASDGLCTKLTNICPQTPPIPHFPDLEVRRDLITMTTRIGFGYFGEVWKGKLHNKIDVAVKKLKPGTMSPESFLDEARRMHQLRHKNLVELVAVCSKQEPILIVTELMANGSLLDYLRKDEAKTVQFPTIIDMASKIAQGMAFLEAESFIHRDLRAANILVSNTLNVKVADFGLARILTSDEEIYEATEKTKFPIKWTAPEAATYRKFSIKSDVWSFGIVMYEMITFGKTPYPGMSGTEVLQNVDRGYRMPKPTSPITYSDAYYEVMLQCWHKTPCNRPTFAYLHGLFDDFDVSTERSYEEQ